MNELDCLLINGEFLQVQIPEDRKFFLHYFHEPESLDLLSYYFRFKDLLKTGTIRRFILCFKEQTGNLFCKDRNIFYWLKRMQQIEDFEREFVQNLDFNSLTELKLGKAKYKLIQKY